MSSCLAGFPRGDRVEPPMAGRAKFDLPAINRTHSDSFGVSWTLGGRDVPGERRFDHGVQGGLVPPNHAPDFLSQRRVDPRDDLNSSVPPRYVPLPTHW